MVTIGDVFTVVAAILAICVSAWAFMLTTALLFRRRTQIAQGAIESRPWKAFGIGSLILLTIGVASLRMIGDPIPGVKLIGTLLMLGLLSVAAVGGGGLAQLIGERMRPMDPALSAYGAIGRGAAIIVVAGLLPLIGWWVFAPVVLAISLGSGVTALSARERAAEISAALDSGGGDATKAACVDPAGGQVGATGHCPPPPCLPPRRRRPTGSTSGTARASG